MQILCNQRSRRESNESMQMVENPNVETECLPFSSIPHTSRLFEDYLHNFDRVKRFYARPPLAQDWWSDEIKKINYPAERRQAVAAILERQNREFGASEKTLANIERLRQGAAAVVTGQQVGLFGGPTFCILKALTAVLMAEKAGAVPMFWLATEDHDLEEINTVNLAAGDHLQKFTVNVPHREGAPVGNIAFTDEITAATQQVEALFGKSEISELLAASYRKGETFGTAFARFYTKVFSEMGVVFLNPLDTELHRIAQPVFRAALEKSEEVNHALVERNHELEEAGYHAQVKVTPSHTLCFYFEDGARTPVRHQDGEFFIGERKLSAADLLNEAERCPEMFSANVLLRPLMQDYLLPTLCYIGGPSEVAYFAQIEVVYRKLAGRVTPVVPRIFATLIEPRAAKLMDRYQLSLPEFFNTPEKTRELVGSRALPDSILKSFDLAAEHVEKALALIQGPLEKLDKTLIDAAENAGSKMRYQLQGIRDKAARAESRKNTEVLRHADELITALYPNKELQEREIGAAYFLLKYGKSVLEQIKTAVRTGCGEHQVIRIQAG
ncbi:MAG TPA: bacillithiol biosynthesis cysteine-adding enzyme BshC [Candidatus Angelobacter sp.]|nr:bacillithiol biosynthesis cysteine-adding enzyme BshC [Candidatus Angelobacter sp.]